MRGFRPKHGYCPEFIFPLSEEGFLVEETDIPASPIPPETARPAEPEVEAATILPLQSHVLPEQETGIAPTGAASVVQWHCCNREGDRRAELLLCIFLL